MKISEFALKVCQAARGLDRKKYKPHWRKWHSPCTISAGEEFCFICLAGAWVAAKLGNPTVQYDPYSHIPTIPGYGFPERNMEALEDIRRGNWVLAAELIGAPPPLFTYDKNFKPSIHNGFDGWDEFDRFLDHVEEQAKQVQTAGF